MGLHWDVTADYNPAAGCNEMRARLTANMSSQVSPSSFLQLVVKYYPVL